jgi:transglutaminase-like putative cysteine protease
VVSVAFIAWRLIAAYRSAPLPGAIARTLTALLLVAGILARFHTLNGLSAGTALLMLMGAIKLLETRSQRDQFVVVAAAVFMLLAACLDRQGLMRAPLYILHAWACCTSLAVIAYVPVVAAPANTSVMLDNRAALLLAARSLAFALPLAVALFIFFPRLPGAFWAIPRSDEAQTGLSDTMSPGSISQLTSSYDVAFRAHFEGNPPPPEERYWRGPVLHEFDGYTWRRNSRNLVQIQPLQYLGTAYRYRISLEPSSQRWWLALDTPTSSPEPKVFLTSDYQLISAEPVTEGTHYSLTSYTSTRAKQPLSEQARRYDLSLPDGRNPRSQELALKMRGSVRSDSAYVESVLEFLRRGGFEYTLTPPRLGMDSVDDFLFRTRLGFCGHYASAFVSLMRAAGVPARVVTGYLGGEWNPIGHYFIVRQSDAHSWAEVWIEGRGWTRVDPTGVVAPERLRRGILDILPNAVSAPARFVWSQPWLASLLQRWDALNTWWNDRVLKFNYGDQLQLLQRLGFKSPSAEDLGYAFGAGLVGWMLWIAWQLGRPTSRSRPDKLARAYRNLCRKLERVGLARRPHDGPLAFAGEIARQRPDLGPDMRSMLMRYAELRYGQPRTDSYPTDVREFERAVRQLKLSVRAAETQLQSQTGS